MEQLADAQLRLIAIGRRHEMMAAFHSVPRDQWLETTIADIRALMGLPSSPQLDKFTRWFLFLAHLQHRLVGVTDNSKVLNYFAMLLPRSLRARRLSVPLVDRQTGDGGVGGQKGKRVDSKWSLSYSEGWHRPYFSRRIGLLSCTRIGSLLHACTEWGYPARACLCMGLSVWVALNRTEKY